MKPKAFVLPKGPAPYHHTSKSLQNAYQISINFQSSPMYTFPSWDHDTYSLWWKSVSHSRKSCRCIRGSESSSANYMWFCPYLGGHSTFDRRDSLTPPSKRSLTEIPSSHMKSGKRLIVQAGKSTVKRRVCYMSSFNFNIIAKNGGYYGCKLVLSPSEVVLKRKL